MIYIWIGLFFQKKKFAPDELIEDLFYFNFFAIHVFLWSSWNVWCTKLFRASLGKFGQISFAPPKICLPLHLCPQTPDSKDWLQQNGCCRFAGSSKMLTRYRRRSNVLLVKNAKPRDAGDYSCVAINEAGTVEKKAMIIGNLLKI